MGWWVCPPRLKQPCLNTCARKQAPTGQVQNKKAQNQPPGGPRALARQAGASSPHSCPGPGHRGAQGHSPRGCGREQRRSSNYATGWRCQQDDHPCRPWARPSPPLILGPRLPAGCALRPGQPLVQTLASLHLSSQCSSASASGHISAVPGLAGLGPELGLRPPDAWSVRWGPTTCHPLGWASCPDQDLVEAVPSSPSALTVRGVWSEHLGSLSRFPHLQSEDK